MLLSTATQSLLPRYPQRGKPSCSSGKGSEGTGVQLPYLWVWTHTSSDVQVREVGSKNSRLIAGAFLFGTFVSNCKWPWGWLETLFRSIFVVGDAFEKLALLCSMPASARRPTWAAEWKRLVCHSQAPPYKSLPWHPGNPVACSEVCIHSGLAFPESYLEILSGKQNKNSQIHDLGN